jgi:hypothetical protein
MPSQLRVYNFSGQTLLKQARQLIINVFVFFALRELGGVAMTEDSPIPSGALKDASQALGLCTKTVEKYVLLALSGMLFFTNNRRQKATPDDVDNPRVMKKLEAEIDRRNSLGEHISLRILA